MRFIIEFGEKEKHRMKYDFNQLFGRLVIMADDRPVKTAYRLVNEPELEVHVFRVGRFEKSRPHREAAQAIAGASQSCFCQRLPG